MAATTSIDNEHTPWLSINSLELGYADHHVLNIPKLELSRANCVGIVGPGDSGKSSLIRWLARANDQQPAAWCRGRVQILGVPVLDDAALQQVQQHVVLLPQRARLFSGSIGENLHQFGDSCAGVNPASVAFLKSLTLWDMLRERLNEPVSSLSVAMHRVLLIARLVARQPRLFLLDDPLTDLAPGDRRVLLEAIRELMRNHRVVMATADERVARKLCDRVIYLNEGQLVDSGQGHDTSTSRLRFGRARFQRKLKPANSGSPVTTRRRLLSDKNQTANECIATQVAKQVNGGRRHTIVDRLSSALMDTMPGMARHPVKTHSADTNPENADSEALGSSNPSGKDRHQTEKAAAAEISQQPYADRSGVALTFSQRLNFHWVLPGRLAGMRQPGLVTDLAEDLQSLVSLGIDTIVTLLEEPIQSDLLQEYPLRWIHFPMAETSVPSLERTVMVVEEIQQLLHDGCSVVVHCRAGLGRTGTLLACVLVRRGLSPGRAIETLRESQPRYIQTEEQMQFVNEYANHLIAVSS